MDSYSNIIKEFIRIVQKMVDRNIKMNKFDLIDLPDTDDELRALILKLSREILSFSRSKVEPLKVSFLGPIGSFSHEACFKYFGSFIEYIPVRTNSDVFEEVEKGNARFGVVAVENSTSGSVVETLDLLLQYDLIIYSEIMLTIHQNLIVKRGTKFEEIKKIFSHPVAFEQCRKWLNVNLPNVERIPVSSTAEGAAMVAKMENTAAIGSIISAKLNDLEVIKERIEDQSGNTTRFLVIGKREHEPTGNDKTSFIFSVAHKPGSLVKVLNILAEYGINMTKLESRPYPGRKWEYVFFVDVEGHINDMKIKKAYEKMKDYCLSLKFLGSYPKSILLD